MSEAILATFSDFKTVKTRSTAQLIFELPIEQADEALRLLGGIPQPGSEKWVGIALAPKDRKETKAERRLFNTLPLSQQAGIRCGDDEFCKFMECPESDIVECVYLICAISSHSELDINEIAGAKWKKLESDFQDYLTTQRYGSGIK